MRRNNRRAGDILGIEELLDAWMDMMTVATNLENEIARKPIVAKPKHEGTMSYEDRDITISKIESTPKGKSVKIQ
jgi:hypothetical protein